jgi:ribosomal 30S subunit maturation factor RimM
VEVLHTEANDVWIVHGSAVTEVLIPALRDVVSEVDIVGKTITVRDVEGITRPSDESSG